MRLFFLNLTTFIKGNRVENPTRLGHVIQSICCSSKITPLGMPFICKKFFPIISNVNFGRPNFPSVTPTKRTTTKQQLREQQPQQPQQLGHLQLPPSLPLQNKANHLVRKGNIMTTPPIARCTTGISENNYGTCE